MVDMLSRAAIAALVISLVAACEAQDSSGQTGSAVCDLPRTRPHCLCLQLIGVPLRVRVASVDADQLVATVEEQYSSDFSPRTVLEPGETVVGTFPLGRPCDQLVLENDVPRTTFEAVAGDELLVLYLPGDAYQSCAAGELGSCGPESERARLAGRFAWAVHFDEELDFGADTVLSPASLDETLRNSDACYQAFGTAPPRCRCSLPIE